MPRRIHVADPLSRGAIVRLDPSQAHHFRDVLRLAAGETVEAFDDAGNLADAIVSRCDPQIVELRIDRVQPRETSRRIVVASAIPKSQRADWMIEKLSELGVERFIPLQTARSVVIESGRNKRERWLRLATESAKQSHRVGVMRIDEMMPLESAIDSVRGLRGFVLSTSPDATPLVKLIDQNSALFIGPEGDWTEDEIARMLTANFTAAKLTDTILRVETAALVAAAIAASSAG